MGILICGLNGTGKSTLGRMLADRMGYEFIDNEDLFYQKFGNRILPGGDLFDQESQWFSLTDNRSEAYVTDWLETVDCPVIRIDGTLPVERNVDYQISVLSEEIRYDQGD